MSTAWHVTPLRPADHARWRELWGAYLRFYKTELPPGIFDHTWARLLEDREIHGLAARAEDGTVHGIVHFLYHAHCWTRARACYLQDLFVDEAARGGGLGRLLIEAVATHARAAGADRMYWMTQSHNTTARLLYDRLATHRGFIRYDYALGG